MAAEALTRYDYEPGEILPDWVIIAHMAEVAELLDSAQRNPHKGNILNKFQNRLHSDYEEFLFNGLIILDQLKLHVDRDENLGEFEVTENNICRIILQTAAFMELFNESRVVLLGEEKVSS